MILDPSLLLGGVCSLARKAGQGIMPFYGAEVQVQYKQDASPLTQADLAAHEIIAHGLAQIAPQLPLISEESPPVNFGIRRTWRTYWLVDPLDGTREFIKRNGEFTVNIGLIAEGKPVLGVVYAPALDLMFHAVTGGGAWRQLGSRPAERIYARLLDRTGVTVAGSRSHAGPRLATFLERIGPHLLLSMGSSLKICLVAEGRADVYPRLGLTSEWDTAAAQCVLEEAGGRLVRLDGAPLRYNTKDSLLNPEFFSAGQGSLDWSQFIGATS